MSAQSCPWEGFPGGSVVENRPANAVHSGDQTISGQEDPLEKERATHSSILAWRIPSDKGAWWVTVHGVAKSQTQLRNEHFHFHLPRKFSHVHVLSVPFDISCFRTSYKRNNLLFTLLYLNSFTQHNAFAVYPCCLCQWLVPFYY